MYYCMWLVYYLFQMPINSFVKCECLNMLICNQITLVSKVKLGPKFKNNTQKVLTCVVSLLPGGKDLIKYI